MSHIKEILCLHHSHLDIGYTHPQPLLMELQRDYIDEAIDLCVQTEHFPEESKFRWTCEATYPVLKWLETSSEERVKLFKKFLQNGQMSISALMMHSTPLNNSEQIGRALYPIKELRKKFNIPLNTAINHDVNGQPWPFSQILLDAGVDFYITGINIHFGGIPFERPKLFKWKTPDSRELLTFHGEHYSLFSQFFETSKSDTELMHKGIKEYVNRLESNGYEYDFIYLTSTNPPLFDNNCPDQELAHLIKQYNEEDREFKIRFVTPEMLLEKVKQIREENIPVYSGDWTDYWNFGSASTARETQLNRKAKQGLRKAEMLEAIQGSFGLHYDQIKKEAFFNMMLFDEHTWGAAHSITDPDDPEVYSQRIHKSKMAYQAADLSSYILGKQMEKLANNPLQSTEPEGVLLVNTSNVEQQVEVCIPKDWLAKGRHLSAARIKQYLPYAILKDDEYFGSVKLEPFSWRKIPLRELNKLKSETANKEVKYIVNEDSLETPYYRLEFDPKTGRIKQLYDKIRSWTMLDETSEWTLFEYVKEGIDPLHNPEKRETFFPRDIDLGNKSISVWNHGWKAKRTSPERVVSWKIHKSANTVSFVTIFEAEGVKYLEQRMTFSVLHPKIEFQAILDKKDVRTPESIYFAFPLRLEAGWRSQYDTAGMFVELDKEQMGNVSKDWVTVDQTVSIYDDKKGVTLACPDAPLVQIGDFNFGKESKSIIRNENPLLLAWPMNNYWDTNFCASQSGNLTFTYVLSPFNQFEEMDAYSVGVYAANPIEINAAINCQEEKSGRLFCGTGEKVVPLYIKRAEDNSGLIATLRNLGVNQSSYKFSIPGKNIISAMIVNTLEEYIDDLEVVDNEVHVDVNGRELLHLKVQIE
ncbi:hypothetical protein K0H71_19890 [Bacillus sp. IITD106]|nr:hypothetical protein [Bacillus sp. IITD106]